tara:strand:+ start:404 stop:715 length:312 start_codon:yes stop_codon:yes gene_type:complete
MISIDEDLPVDDITPDGIWILKSGQTIDLRHVQLELPDGKGNEWVQAITTDPRGRYDVCPLCGGELDENSTIVSLEKHHYLIVRCCKEWLLYENEEINKEEWI